MYCMKRPQHVGHWRRLKTLKRRAELIATVRRGAIIYAVLSPVSCEYAGTRKVRPVIFSLNQPGQLRNFGTSSQPLPRYNIELAARENLAKNSLHSAGFTTLIIPVVNPAERDLRLDYMDGKWRGFGVSLRVCIIVPDGPAGVYLHLFGLMQILKELNKKWFATKPLNKPEGWKLKKKRDNTDSNQNFVSQEIVLLTTLQIWLNQ